MKIRDKEGNEVGMDKLDEGNPKCGTCLMERVDFTELRDDGTCPVCDPTTVKAKRKGKRS